MCEINSDQECQLNQKLKIQAVTPTDLSLKLGKITIPFNQAMNILVVAPKGAELFYWYGERFDRRVDYYKYFFNYLQVWLPNHGWFPVPDHLADDTITMSGLCTAIDNFSKQGNTHE